MARVHISRLVDNVRHPLAALMCMALLVACGATALETHAANEPLLGSYTRVAVSRELHAVAAHTAAAHGVTLVSLDAAARKTTNPPTYRLECTVEGEGGEEEARVFIHKGVVAAAPAGDAAMPDAAPAAREPCAVHDTAEGGEEAHEEGMDAAETGDAAEADADAGTRAGDSDVQVVALRRVESREGAAAVSSTREWELREGAPVQRRSREAVAVAAAAVGDGEHVDKIVWMRRSGDTYSMQLRVDGITRMLEVDMTEAALEAALAAMPHPAAPTAATPRRTSAHRRGAHHANHAHGHARASGGSKRLARHSSAVQTAARRAVAEYASEHGVRARMNKVVSAEAVDSGDLMRLRVSITREDGTYKLVEMLARAPRDGADESKDATGAVEAPVTDAVPVDAQPQGEGEVEKEKVQEAPAAPAAEDDGFRVLDVNAPGVGDVVRDAVQRLGRVEGHRFVLRHVNGVERKVTTVPHVYRLDVMLFNTSERRVEQRVLVAGREL